MKISICIPTKDRSILVERAIQSLLNNTCLDDIEIIISDNSSYLQNYSFANNNNIKILSDTSSISPWDNWKKAAQQANGDYVIMFPDKCIASINLIKEIKQNIKQYNPEVLLWKISFNENFSSQYDYKIEQLTAEDSVKKLLLMDIYQNDYFPHGMNCCYKRFEGHENMYKPFCADYSQGMELIVNQKKSVSFIDLPLMRIPRLSKLEHSTGASLERGLDNAATRQYLKFFPLDQKEKMVENMPIKDFNFQTNVILYDLMNAAGSKEFISLLNETIDTLERQEWLNTKKITYIGGPIDWAAMVVFIKRLVRDVKNRFFKL